MLTIKLNYEQIIENISFIVCIYNLFRIILHIIKFNILIFHYNTFRIFIIYLYHKLYDDENYLD